MQQGVPDSGHSDFNRVIYSNVLAVLVDYFGFPFLSEAYAITQHVRQEVKIVKSANNESPEWIYKQAELITKIYLKQSPSLVNRINADKFNGDYKDRQMLPIDFSQRNIANSIFKFGCLLIGRENPDHCRVVLVLHYLIVYDVNEIETLSNYNSKELDKMITQGSIRLKMLTGFFTLTSIPLLSPTPNPK